MGSKSRRRFTKEQKEEAVRLYRSSGESYSTIAQEKVFGRLRFATGLDRQILITVKVHTEL